MRQLMNRLNFSGHESFHCRSTWLKKGFDYINEGCNFSDPQGIVRLGVGKNMLTSIQYWMSAFGLFDSHKQVSEVANFILDTEGRDPFLEDPASLWLLHYYLVKTGKASIFSLVFNEFRKERVEFTKDHLYGFITRKCSEEKTPFSSNTIKKDISVFLRTYLRPTNTSTDIENQFSGLLVDCELIESFRGEEEHVEWFRIANSSGDHIPDEIILFGILDSINSESSISVNTLLVEQDSVGSIFALNREGLVRKLKRLQLRYKNLVYSDDAGIREIQLKETIDKWAVLDDYYRQ